MTETDPGLAARRRLLAIAACVFLTALDGYDVLAISFAAPGIAREWGIDRAALGVVLSMELVGMAAGSILLGRLADRRGRKPLILACLALMTAGMFLSAISSSVVQLSILRLTTGLGIGGMLATTNALAGELAPPRWRSTAVVAMATGFPIGAILGGLALGPVLAGYDWRAIFILGGVVSAIALPVLARTLPESPAWLASKAIDPAREDHSRPVNAPLFADRTKVIATALICAAYLFHIITFYFIQKWTPKIVVDLGFSDVEASRVLVWVNLGGLCGAITFAALSVRLALRPLLILFMIASFLAVALFGFMTEPLHRFSLVAAIAGFFANAGVVGLYALTAAGFPAAYRAQGSGLVLGVGRGGSALGPLAGGLLFSAGLGLPLVAVLMGGFSLLGAVAVLVLGRAALASPDDRLA